MFMVGMVVVTVSAINIMENMCETVYAEPPSDVFSDIKTSPCPASGAVDQPDHPKGASKKDPVGLFHGHLVLGDGRVILGHQAFPITRLTVQDARVPPITWQGMFRAPSGSTATTFECSWDPVVGFVPVTASRLRHCDTDNLSRLPWSTSTHDDGSYRFLPLVTPRLYLRLRDQDDKNVSALLQHVLKCEKTSKVRLFNMRSKRWDVFEPFDLTYLLYVDPAFEEIRESLMDTIRLPLFAAAELFLSGCGLLSSDNPTDPGFMPDQADVCNGSGVTIVAHAVPVVQRSDDPDQEALVALLSQIHDRAIDTINKTVTFIGDRLD